MKMFLIRNQIAIIISLTFFQFLDKMKSAEGSPAVETFCKDLCPIEDSDNIAETIEETEMCEKLCFVRVEVENFGRRISILQWENAPNANVILSSYNIVALLNLLMMGTSGSTSKEIRDAIGYSEDLEESYIHETFKNFISILHGEQRGVELFFHTALFFQEGISILDSFNETAVRIYLAKIEYLNFQTSPDTAKESINTWVSEQTEGRINEIISAPLSQDTKCIGVSFMEFKSSWAFGFNSSLTENGIFYTGTKETTIPMMTTLMNVYYSRNEDIGFEIISLPFMMNSFAMIILQPLGNSDINELKTIEDSLNPQLLWSTLNGMKPKHMKVTIPKMELKFRLSLKEDLQSFGVNQIFNPGADFGRMSSDTGIIINDLLYAGNLEVNEAGVNTDTVSNEIVTTSDGSFHLNKSSLTFIIDKENKFIILWGKIIDPQLLS